MQRLACLVRGSAPSVLNWSRAVATAYDGKPAPTGRRIVLARDEMWHDVQEKRQKLWSWQALDWETGQRLDWACGRRGKATEKQMVDRLARGDVQRYGTAHWATSASVIPQDQLGQSQATTHAIARHHGRQRHRCGRFTRKSIMISQSKAMVDLTRALLAKFWVNGNRDELLSRLD